MRMDPSRSYSTEILVIVKNAVDWLKGYGPTLVNTKQGDTVVGTILLGRLDVRLNWLLGSHLALSCRSLLRLL